ncbi:MAG: hypothetical protein IPM91_11110 [Bacteroidetes bacterium]|nr:hypothetical protein [Bacteroidota bacterium]
MADATCIPIYFLSKLAREKGTIVVQTGDGADELFAGYRAWLQYNRYYPLYHFYSKTPAFFRQELQELLMKQKMRHLHSENYFPEQQRAKNFFGAGHGRSKKAPKDHSSPLHSIRRLPN